VALREASGDTSALCVLFQDPAMVSGLDVAAVSHEVSIAVRKDDDVPGREQDPLTVLHLSVSPASR
jgi:hypothetical protein